MANVLVEESYLQGIANAIRSKNGTLNTYTPAQMSTAISNIPTSGGGGISLSSGQTAYIYDACLELEVYKTKTYMNGGLSVGRTLIYNSTPNNWRIAKVALEANKVYLCKTYYGDSGDCKVVVTDDDNKILWIYKSSIAQVYYVIDTSDFDSTNGLVIHVAIDKNLDLQLNCDDDYSGGQAFDNNKVYVRGITVISSQSS